MAQGLFTLKQVNQAIRQGAWSAINSPQFVEYLCVAGGGGGSAYTSGGSGAGGGAGGLLTGLLPVTVGSSITITVGAGGAGANNVRANPGVASSIAGSGVTFVSATGGGGGGVRGAGANQQSGGSGGSGGGAANAETPPQVGGQGVANQGNAGGFDRGPDGAPFSAAGGGGAGTVGGNARSVGYGGAGIASAISGTVTAYAGGGGGGSYDSIGGTGGVGGGGNGGSNTSGGATSGTANTGGGGGGIARDTPSGTSGGSGIVIVSYPDNFAAATSTTGSPTVSTSGSGSLSFSGSGQYIAYTSNAAFALPGDFTLEMWMYPLNWDAANILPYATYPGTDGGLMIGKVSSNFAIRAANTGDQLTYGTFPTVNTWTHVVAVRSGTTLSLYYNGTRVATTTNSFSFAQALLKIGSDGFGSDFPGYLSNVRLVKGTAVYNPSLTTLTVPTAPLTAVSGTSILLNTVSPNGYLDSSTNSFTPTLTGAPTWNQLSPFTTGLGYKNRVYTWTSSGSITI
jgi:hypothetical protein